MGEIELPRDNEHLVRRLHVLGEEIDKWKSLAGKMNNLLIAIRTQAKANGWKNIESLCRGLNAKAREAGL